jgi:hypothetical protein
MKSTPPENISENAEDQKGKVISSRKPKQLSPDRLHLTVLTRDNLKGLAIVSLLITFSFLVFGIVNPTRFENETARFLLAVGVATSLSIFFFLFYPQKIELSLPAWFGKPLHVVGPIALWFVVLFFLLHEMPSPETGRLFVISIPGEVGKYFYSPETELKDADGNRIKCHLIREGDKLYGVYVYFKSTIKSYKASISHDGLPDMQGTFSREGPYDVRLQPIKK